MENRIKEKIPVWFPVAPIMVIVCIYCVLLLADQIVVWLNIGNELSIPFPIGYIVGWPLIVIGLAYFFWGFYQLRPAAAIGFAKRLRDKGAYGLTRNPMYFGLNAAFWGVGLVLDKTSIVIGAFIWSSMNYLSVTLWEEKQMYGKFGDEYLEYKKRVSRFIPIKLNRSDLS